MHGENVSSRPQTSGTQTQEKVNRNDLAIMEWVSFPTHTVTDMGLLENTSNVLLISVCALLLLVNTAMLIAMWRLRKSVKTQGLILSSVSKLILARSKSSLKHDPNAISVFTQWMKKDTETSPE